MSALDPIQVALNRFNTIIDLVEARCLAADGPVTPTLNEMREDELAELWIEVQSIRAYLEAAPSGQAPLEGVKAIINRVLREHAGPEHGRAIGEGGCPRVDWYALRNELVAALLPASAEPDGDLLDQAVAFAEMWGAEQNWPHVRDAYVAAILRERAKGQAEVAASPPASAEPVDADALSRLLALALEQCREPCPPPGQYRPCDYARNWLIAQGAVFRPAASPAAPTEGR